MEEENKYEDKLQEIKILQKEKIKNNNCNELDLMLNEDEKINEKAR